MPGPGLPIGSEESDLLLPLSLVALLFDARIHVTATEDEITLVSRRGRTTVGLSDVSTFGLQEIRYQGYANRYLGSSNGGMTLENRSRIKRGQLHSQVFGQFADSAGVFPHRCGAQWRRAQGVVHSV